MEVEFMGVEKVKVSRLWAKARTRQSDKRHGIILLIHKPLL